MKIKLKTESEKKMNNEFVKKICVQKAEKVLGIASVVFIFDMFTYFVALALHYFDFGILFEGTSFVFLLLTLLMIRKNKIKQSVVMLVISYISISLILVYDIVMMLGQWEEYLLILTGVLLPSLYDVMELMVIAIFGMEIYGLSNLIRASKIESEIKNGRGESSYSKDWFYEEK